MSKIYVEVRSGLGNQLFQFAFGYALAKEFNKDLVLCPSYYDNTLKYWSKKLLGREARAFQLPLILKNKFAWSKLPLLNHQQQNPDLVILKEEELEIQKVRSMAATNRNIYLKGYWQNPIFFSSIHHELVELISPSFSFSKKCREILNRLNDKYIGIHVRRGDFLTNRSFGACTIDYYVQATRNISVTVHNPTFVIFTNDRKWVQDHFPKNISYIIYSNTKENSAIEEMYLMTKFSALIISNSTFSWWGAYLNANEPKQIICPATWFLKNELQKNAGNFIAKDWIVIPNQLELKS